MSGVRFDFAGARVVVTGGTSGIGGGVAAAFATARASVLVTGTRPVAADYDADLSGYDYRSCQLGDTASVDALVAGLDRVDVLVNNAGANLPGGRDEPRPDVFADSVAINLNDPFRLAVGCRDRLAGATLPVDGGYSSA